MRCPARERCSREDRRVRREIGMRLGRVWLGFGLAVLFVMLSRWAGAAEPLETPLTTPTRAVFERLLETFRNGDHQSGFALLTDHPGQRKGMEELLGGLYSSVKDLRPDLERFFLSHVEEEELLALYRACAVLVYQSEYEGFGLPVIEAMACGAPVVTSRTASLPEVAGESALYAPLDDEAALAEAIRRILTDVRLTADLRRWGPERAALFRWEQCATRTLDALEEAARLSSRRPAVGTAPRARLGVR